MPAALILSAPQTLEVKEREREPIQTGEVRLQVEATGICGSDVHGYAGMNDRRPIGVVMGYETIGRVTEIDSDVELNVGDRVAVNPVVACGNCTFCKAGSDNLCRNRRIYGCSLELDGGLATEMTVKADNCVRVDPNANVVGLAWIEPLAVGTHALGLAPPTSEDLVLIVGGGPIGIAVALACINASTTPMICEPSPDRRAIAEALGATTCAPDDLPRAEGTYDLAFECVGTSGTVASAVTSVRPEGTVICLGLAAETVEIPSMPLAIYERRVIGSSAYTTLDFEKTAHWATERADDLASLVMRTADLDEMPSVFADYHAGRLTAMKTLYLPREVV